MTVTVTQPPTLGALVGNIDSEFDRTGAAGAGHARLSLVWPAVRRGAASAMHDAIDRADLLDLLAKGWAEAKTLKRRVADDMKTNKDLSNTITLGSHDQDITLDPGLTITVNGVDTHKLPMSLALSVSIDSAELTLQAGRIVEVALGKVSASGALKCGEIVTPLNLATPEFNLLGKHALKQAVPIAGE